MDYHRYGFFWDVIYDWVLNAFKFKLCLDYGFIAYTRIEKMKP